MITLEQAHAAKDKLQAILRPDSAMLGITKAGENYAVKIGLYDWPDTVAFPQEIDGVEVIVTLAGKLKAQMLEEIEKWETDK